MSVLRAPRSSFFVNMAFCPDFMALCHQKNEFDLTRRNRDDIIFLKIRGSIHRRKRRARYASEKTADGLEYVEYVWP